MSTLIKQLRDEANTLLAQCPAPRKPALRRADRDEWLLCTDLPLLTGDESLQQLLQQLHHAHWHTHVINGWLYLDHPLPSPSYAAIPVCAGEMHCVLSLLSRHTDTCCPDDASWRRRLVKAAEQSPTKLQECCRQLHAYLAQQLRLKQPLPTGLIGLLIQLAKSAEAPECHTQR